MQQLSKAQACASLQNYLEELRESGVDGLPLAPVLPVRPVESPAAAVSPDVSEEVVSLAEVRTRLGDCQRCDLAQTRTKLVFGVGNPDARLLFVGEAPGAEEDQQGEPFVGEAGRILNRIIEAMGLGRQSVYICNVLKCRPPGDRNPHKQEIEACAWALQQQIAAVAPEVIVALGTFAAQTLLHSKEPISKLRGQFHHYHGIPLMPTFHPAFLQRNTANKEHYWEVWRDMEQVLQKLGLPVPEKKQRQQ